MTKGELRRELDLPGGDFSSVANDVSDDGLVVVGSSNGASGREAFRFTVLDGPHGIGQMEGLGIPSGAPSSSGKRVSSDGSVIVGRSETGAFESYRWEAGVMSLLPGLPGDSSSTYTGFGAKGVSGDGSVVVGASDSANGPEGYVWSAQTGQVVGIGDLPGGSFFSAARDVSYDGTIVVGLSEGYTIPKSGTQSATHAIRWTANTGLEVLWSNGYAEATSADGSVVVGYHEYVGQMPHSGVRWTRETGAVMMPGMLTWSISGDGSVIGGVAADRAAIWDEVHGVRNLQQVLSTDYGIVLDAGWHLDNVYGISYDGSTIVGLATNPQGFQEGYIVHLAQGRGITVTPTAGLETSESGAATTFSVVLKTQPTADVTIGVSSTDTTEGTVSATSLVFTVSNWNVPQIVTVTGVDDAVADGNQPYTIQLAPAVSTDPDYNGLNAADVTVTNLDNDTPPTKFFVVDDGTANQTFEYSVSGSPIESYALGSANATPRGVATTAAGDKVWVVDANRTVYVYDAAGTTLGSWSAGSLASNAIPEGIATNGTDLWIVDNKSDKVFRYTGAASRLSGSQTAASSFSLASGNTNPKDIVTNGTSLWVVNDATSDKVFKYALGGTAQGNWTIDAANKAPTGITLDPTSPSDIWIVDNGTDRVYQYTSAASRTSGSQSAAASFALAAGKMNPQGIADPPVAAAALAVSADNLSNSAATIAISTSITSPINKPIGSNALNKSTTSAAAKSQTPSLLLALAPTRQLPSAAVDSALADFGDDGSAGWEDALDDELLLALASAPSQQATLSKL